jgi:hypothetical protein
MLMSDVVKTYKNRDTIMKQKVRRLEERLFSCIEGEIGVNLNTDTKINVRRFGGKN